MKWSKLKQRIEETFAKSVKNNIIINNTVYRKSYDASNLSIIRIEINKKEIVSFSDIKSDVNFMALVHENTPADCAKHKAIKKEDRTKGKLLEDGEFSSLDFKIMGFEYLNTNAHDCLKSEHPILRLLGTLNKKVGKNKLREMIDDEHPLVSYFAQYRLEQELKQ